VGESSIESGTLFNNSISQFLDFFYPEAKQGGQTFIPVPPTLFTS